MSNSRIAIAILASGNASRFGDDKLWVGLGGKPLAAHAIDTAVEASTALSSPHANVATAIIAPQRNHQWWRHRFADPEIIENVEAETGLSTSLKHAAHWAMRIKAAGLIILLADMPFISIKMIKELFGHAKAGARAAYRHDRGALGPPATFPATDMPDLCNIKGDNGARTLLNTQDTQAIIAPTGALLDVDTPKDLANAREQLAENDPQNRARLTN